MIRFGEYFRPGQLAFYKSSDYGQTYEPWHYFVSTADPNECQDKFNRPIINNPVTVDQVLCMVYTTPQVDRNAEVCIYNHFILKIFPFITNNFFGSVVSELLYHIQGFH